MTPEKAIAVEAKDSAPKAHTFQPDIYNKVLEFIPPNRATSILDLGAGEGFFCRKLKDLGYAVDACDFLPEIFKCPDIPFIPSNLNQGIACADNTYDCVVSIEVAEHVENHFLFMAEAFRVVKPGGLVIITTPNFTSLPSRWHFFKFGFNDCAPVPIDPHKPEYFLEHINPISLPELLFQVERNHGEVVDVSTNRLRKSAWIPTIIFYPFLHLAMRHKLLRKRHSGRHERHRHYIHWMMKPANLMGRITILIARKQA